MRDLARAISASQWLDALALMINSHTTFRID
jgi:hypothetical protein